MRWPPWSRRSAEHGVAGLEQAQVDGHVRLGARVRLDVRVLGAEERLRAVDRELLDPVDELAAAVVALARVALGVLVRRHRAEGLEDDGQVKFSEAISSIWPRCRSSSSRAAPRRQGRSRRGRRLASGRGGGHHGSRCYTAFSLEQATTLTPLGGRSNERARALRPLSDGLDERTEERLPPFGGAPGASARTTTWKMGTRAASIPRMDRARQGILAEPRPVVALIVLVAVATAVALAAAAPEIRDIAGRDPGAFVAFGLLAVGLTFTSVEIYGRGAVSFAGCALLATGFALGPGPALLYAILVAAINLARRRGMLYRAMFDAGTLGLAAASAALVYEALTARFDGTAAGFLGIAAGGLRLPDRQSRAPQLRHGGSRKPSIPPPCGGSASAG